MSSIVLQWDTRQIDKVFGDRGAERALLKSLKYAGRDALRMLKSSSSRYVRSRKRLKVSRVNKAMITDPARGNEIRDLSWTLRVSGKPVPLIDYPHRQTRKGVMVSVNRNTRVLVKSAFLATMRSGHEGIFKRVGRARLPIRELFSSTVKDPLLDNGTIPALFTRASASFAKTFDRVLPLALNEVIK